MLLISVLFELTGHSNINDLCDGWRFPREKNTGNLNRSHCINVSLYYAARLTLNTCFFLDTSYSSNQGFRLVIKKVA